MKYLSIYAGTKATGIIAEQGLKPDMVEVVAGAAGGPKWLVLCGLDRAIFGSWLMERKTPVHLVGSSVGSWRFAALAQGMDAYERFLDAYFRQTYATVPTARMVSDEIGKILDAYLDEQGIGRALNHPHARLSIMATRCSWPGSEERKYLVLLSMIIAGLLNLVDRRLLGLSFSRTLFYDARDLPPFFPMSGFPIRQVKLTRDNVRQAVLASGSMPVIMEGIRNIPGAQPGMYRDAGILDYHLGIPFNSTGLVLYPHYADRITPGWFDKLLFWRRPDGKDLEKVVLLCPSKGFVDRLPGGKIPSREDFRQFWKHDAERIAFWNRVVSASAVMGDEFLEALEKGTIHEHIRPIEEL
ncbi:MAG TPA: patatin-like phospholipase family protein [Desulfomonilia bacterium]|nr:patatin-like phospholipase family protein [Desulfomonilia bacterium]